MPNRSNQLIPGSSRALVVAGWILIGLILVSAGCRSKPSEPVRRFHLHGKIVFIDVGTGSAAVEHDAIPGFMDAMTMSYPIPDKKVLSTLRRGDEITADVVVVDGVAHLENVVVVKPAAKPDPTSSSDFHMPQPGDVVPDFALLDQSDRVIHLRSYRGDALLLTFIYTRCPFADFCPRVSDHFARIYATLRKAPSAGSKIRLLSVSFDPHHDTPEVLRQYAATLRYATATDRPFDRWEFATASVNELPKIARFFGLYYTAQNGQIIHSMSTSLISPDGKIVAWFHDNDWNPQDVLSQAVRILGASQVHNAKKENPSYGSSAAPSIGRVGR